MLVRMYGLTQQSESQIWFFSRLTTLNLVLDDFMYGLQGINLFL